MEKGDAPFYDARWRMWETVHMKMNQEQILGQFAPIFLNFVLYYTPKYVLGSFSCEQPHTLFISPDTCDVLKQFCFMLFLMQE